MSKSAAFVSSADNQLFTSPGFNLTPQVAFQVSMAHQDELVRVIDQVSIKICPKKEDPSLTQKFIDVECRKVFARS